MAVRKVSEHLFRLVCDTCGDSILSRAGNSWGVYQQARMAGWGIAKYDSCRDCIPVEAKKKVRA